MWNPPLIFFEDEDEDELINEFVRLSAKYKGKGRDPYEIASYVFRNLKDKELRAAQAAMRWSNDLEIIERIDNYAVEKNIKDEPLTKEILQAKVMALNEDRSIPYQDKKVMIEGYKAVAEFNGWVLKAVDKKITKARQLPQVLQTIGDFHADNRPN